MKFASANYQMSWNKGLNTIFCDFTYCCNDSDHVTPRAESYVSALIAYATSAGIAYTLKKDGAPSLNIGANVSRLPKYQPITISFALAKVDDYFENGQAITGYRKDFDDYVDTYGKSGAFEHIFRDAIDEFNTSANLKDYVVLNVTITDNTI